MHSICIHTLMSSWVAASLRAYAAVRRGVIAPTRSPERSLGSPRVMLLAKSPAGIHNLFREILSYPPEHIAASILDHHRCILQKLSKDDSSRSRACRQCSFLHMRLPAILVRAGNHPYPPLLRLAPRIGWANRTAIRAGAVRGSLGCLSTRSDPCKMQQTSSAGSTTYKSTFLCRPDLEMGWYSTIYPHMRVSLETILLGM